MKNKPLCVLISDVHFSLKTLDLASIAFKNAILEAARLGTPLIDCGDITNDKAMLRAEVMNEMIELFEYAAFKGVEVYCLVGNHSLINEKGKDHALKFLSPYATIVDKPCTIRGFNFIPYQVNSQDFYDNLNEFDKGSIVFAHQGTLGGWLGDYVKDSSAFDPKLTTAYRLYLGHYHRHYILENTVSIGNPYTYSWGEASDGPKGYLIVNEDGTYERKILNLRKHIIYNVEIRSEGVVVKACKSIEDGDLIWVKIKGPKADLDKITKKGVAQFYLGDPDNMNFKLDKIPTDEAILVPPTKNLSSIEILDKIIDSMPGVDTAYLKSIYKELLSEDK